MDAIESRPVSRAVEGYGKYALGLEICVGDTGLGNVKDVDIVVVVEQ